LRRRGERRNMNSYEELAVSQPVTKMKMEVEKHIGQAGAQHTPTRSRALEQKEEIFSKEIKGIIQRLEEQGTGPSSSLSSPSLSSAKSGNGSGATKEKMLGDQISFTDVSFLCKEMPQGTTRTLQSRETTSSPSQLVVFVLSSFYL
jgi:hypothetical protein